MSEIYLTSQQTADYYDCGRNFVKKYENILGLNKIKKGNRNLYTLSSVLRAYNKMNNRPNHQDKIKFNKWILGN